MDEFDPVHPDYTEEQTAAPAASLLGQRVDQVESQQSTTENVVDSFQATTALAKGARLVSDEAEAVGDHNFAFVGNDTARLVLGGVGSLVGMGSGPADYDRSKEYDNLVRGIPSQYHDDITAHDNLAAAQRSRARVQEQIERGQRIGKQVGISPVVAGFLGSVVDVDLPLAVMSGGGYGAAKLSRATLKTARAAGASPRAAQRMGSTAIGLSGGIQAGAVVGVAQAAWDETTDWTAIPAMILENAAMGGALGGAFNLDARSVMRGARSEFLDRVARDDPTLKLDHSNTENWEPNGLPLRQLPTEGAVLDSSAGAQQVQPQVQRVPSPDEAPRHAEVLDDAHDWWYKSGWGSGKRSAEEEQVYQTMINSRLGDTLGRDYNALLKSESKVANYFAGAIFESPHSYGRNQRTASIDMDRFQRQIMEHVPRTDSAASRWAKRNNGTLMNTGYGTTYSARAAFNREVILEVNAQRHGKSHTADPDILDAVEAYKQSGSTALDIQQDLRWNGARPVEGFDTIPRDNKPWLPYNWTSSTYRGWLREGRVSEQSVVNALRDGYLSSSSWSPDHAEKVAKAVVTRLRQDEFGVSGSLRDIMNGDSRETFEVMLKNAGVSRQDIEAILERVTGNKEEAGRSSHAKFRNEIDLSIPIATTDGSTLALADLMDQDLTKVWARYARGSAGRGAMAQAGVPSSAKMETMIEAMNIEKAALGEDSIEPERMRAMLSPFFGGIQHGFANGQRNEGISGPFEALRRFASLSLLGKLGMAQLAETGAPMAAAGMANWYNRAIGQQIDAMGRAERQKVLNDLAFMTGGIGKDHHYFTPHLHLDEVSAKDGAKFLNGVNRTLATGQWLQGYTSLFNNIRSWQQTTAALGTTDKLLKDLKNGKLDRFRALEDYGLNDDILDELQKLMDNGTITFGKRGSTEYVDALNMDKWDRETADVFGNTITRAINQQVQKSVPGETDMWMHTQGASLFVHLKTFPLQAVTKQAVRNARFADSEAIGTLFYGFGTALMAVHIRDMLDGRERDTADRVRAAVSYSNMTGFVPMVWDPAMTVLGMDNARINPFGDRYQMTIPTVDVANRIMGLPGAVGAIATGEDTKKDWQAVKSIPFFNSYLISRLFD